MLSNVEFSFVQFPVVFAILIGVALAAYLLGYSSNLRRGTFITFWSRALIIAAVVYLGFALVSGQFDKILLETFGLLVFTAIAYVGKKKWPSMLVAGWVLHLCWDLMLHPILGETTSYAPWWYPSICIGFDLFAAGSIFIITSTKNKF